MVLDPGHGGQDSGAKVGGIPEKDLTLDVAQRVDRLMQAQGLATVMTRVGDSYVSLAERASLTNGVPDCVLVSIHFNEGNKPVSSGVETYYAAHRIRPGWSVASWLPFLAASDCPQRRISKAKAWQPSSRKGWRREPKRPIAERNPNTSSSSQMSDIRPYWLKEDFSRTSEDMARLASDVYREQMAAAISEGIIRLSRSL